MGSDIEPKLVNLLCDNGADIKACNNEGNTPLHEAFGTYRYGSNDILKLLVTDKTLVAQNATGDTPVHVLCVDGTFDACNEKIKEDIFASDVLDMCNNDGYTPVELAILHANGAVVDYLEEAVVLLDWITAGFSGKNGDSLLHTAVHSNNSKMVTRVLANIKDAQRKDYIDQINDYSGQTPLLTAVALNDYDIIELLVESGANINAQDRDGNTVLHFAVENQSPELVEYLIDNGVDVRIENNKGEKSFDFILPNRESDDNQSKSDDETDQLTNVVDESNDESKKSDEQEKTILIFSSDESDSDSW